MGNRNTMVAVIIITTTVVTTTVTIIMIQWRIRCTILKEPNTRQLTSLNPLMGEWGLGLGLEVAWVEHMQTIIVGLGLTRTICEEVCTRLGRDLRLTASCTMGGLGVQIVNKLVKMRQTMITN